MITNLNNYLRQHSEIAKISKLIEDSALLNNEKIVENVKDITLNLNTLSGKLKVHLAAEDKFLYPELKNSDDVKTKDIATKFENEMGHIANDFAKYWEKYNFPKKIIENIENFKLDTKEIFAELSNRWNKEEKELYIL